jgi:hypothetical protein
VLTETQQKHYLINKKGDPVVFTYPEPPYHLKGLLKDRHVTKGGEDDTVAYWNVIDLIEFKGEDEDWIRFTYYRYKKKENKWVFAGQTSLSDPMSYFSELFENAVKEKKWIRPIFREVAEKCSKELQEN